MPESDDGGVGIRWWDHIGLWVGVIPIFILMGGVVFAAWYWPWTFNQREKYRRTAMEKYCDDFFHHDTVEAYRKRLLAGRIAGGVAGVGLCLYLSTGVKKKKSQ